MWSGSGTQWRSHEPRAYKTPNRIINPTAPNACFAIISLFGSQMSDGPPAKRVKSARKIVAKYPTGSAEVTIGPATEAIIWTISHAFRSSTPPHARRVMCLLCLVAMLIGCRLVLAIRFYDRFTSSGTHNGTFHADEALVRDFMACCPQFWAAPSYKWSFMSTTSAWSRTRALKLSDFVRRFDVLVRKLVRI